MLDRKIMPENLGTQQQIRKKQKNMQMNERIDVLKTNI